MNKCKSVILIGLTISFWMASFVIGGCTDSGYKLLSMKEGIQPFAFEYPSTYALIRLDLRNDDSAKYTEVGFSTSYGTSYSEIYVYIWNAGSGLNSASTMMDQLLSGAESMKDYILISRNSVVLDDRLTEQCIFTADSTVDDLASTIPKAEMPARPATYRISTMIYDGFAIEIDLTCDQSLTDFVQEDYQHLLDTLKVG
jgi:hypothetical protein